MSIVDKDLQNENLELRNKVNSLENELKEFIQLFVKLDDACNSDDDTEFDDESETDSDSEMGSCDEESTDEELNYPKCKLENDNLEVKINT